jgi:hypothetical protein
MMTMMTITDMDINMDTNTGTSINMVSVDKNNGQDLIKDFGKETEFC